MNRTVTQAFPVYETFRDGAFTSSFFNIKPLEEYAYDLGLACQPHRYDCYHLIFITNGSGTYTVDFNHYDIQPLTVFLITPGQVQSWSLSEDISGFMIFFTPLFYTLDKSEQHLQALPFFQDQNNQYCLYLDRNREAVLILILQEMHYESNHNEYGHDELLRNWLRILFIHLSRNYRQTSIHKSPPAATLRMRQLESLINKHFQSLKFPYQYARLMHVTPKHLNHMCKQALNKTVSALIHRRLMLEAERLLLHSNLPVKAVADQLGFSDKSHFIRFFKKRSGMTPERFRRYTLIVPHDA